MSYTTITDNYSRADFEDGDATYCAACGADDILNDRDLCKHCEPLFCIVCGDDSPDYPYCGVQCQVDDLLAKGGAA